MQDEEQAETAETPPVFLTTREVADLLRVKERKVYDMAAAGEIPHRRITGKLLFPRSDLMAWLSAGSDETPGERPAVIAGSHDPLLDWAVRESGSGLALVQNGSREGLEFFTKGRAAVAGLHVFEDGDWNIATVETLALRDAVLMTWAQRSRGLILAPALDHIGGVADLAGRRIALRQDGAGASVLLDALLRDAGMSVDDLSPAPEIARTESDAAAAIAAGEADAALGIAAMATRFNLPFLPLVQERFDLLIDRRSFFTAPVQDLFRFARSDRFREKARAMGGYDVGGTGEVRWLSP